MANTLEEFEQKRSAIVGHLVSIHGLSEADAEDVFGDATVLSLHYDNSNPKWMRNCVYAALMKHKRRRAVISFSDCSFDELLQIDGTIDERSEEAWASEGQQEQAEAGRKRGGQAGRARKKGPKKGRKVNG